MRNIALSLLMVILAVLVLLVVATVSVAAKTALIRPQKLLAPHRADSTALTLACVTRACAED